MYLVYLILAYRLLPLPTSSAAITSSPISTSSIKKNAEGLLTRVSKLTSIRNLYFATRSLLLVSYLNGLDSIAAASDIFRTIIR